jgi:hypothetical protein
MKTTRNILSVLVAAGTPGVALLVLTNLPADVVLAGFTTVAVIAFAIFDYSRPAATLKVPGVVIRPPLRALTTTRPALARKVA